MIGAGSRTVLLLALGVAGCRNESPAILLLSELPDEISRVAVMRFDESGEPTGSTGLLGTEQLPLQFEDDLAASVSVAGFSSAQLSELRLPPAAVVEMTPVRLARETDRRLPVPAYRAGGPVVDGAVSLAPEAPLELTVAWLTGTCPIPVAGRSERVSDRNQFLGFAKLDDENALLVTAGSGGTELYRADIERTERVEPPNFAETGPGAFSSTALHVEAGVIWIASEPEDGRTRIFRGTLEAGFELVATSTGGERIGWLAPDETDPTALWLLASDGVFFRLEEGGTTWRRYTEFPGVAVGPGRIAREADGSLVALHRGFPVRELARIRPGGEVQLITREDRQRPIYLADLDPHPTFLAHDGLSSRIYEVRGDDLVAWPGTEPGAATVEPLTMARIAGGFAISGVQGFLLLFLDGVFCPVASGLLGPNTVESIVEIEGGLLSGPGPLRTGNGSADLTRVTLE